MDAVALELRRWAGEPFRYGANDCAQAVADYVRARTGKDAAEGLRGTYATELGCARVLRRHGGLLGVMTARFDPLLERTDDPIRGDIGVVLAPASVPAAIGGAVAAIYLGSYQWAMRSPKGVTIGETEPMCMWRVPCPRS